MRKCYVTDNTALLSLGLGQTIWSKYFSIPQDPQLDQVTASHSAGSIRHSWLFFLPWLILSPAHTCSLGLHHKINCLRVLE